MAVIPIKLGKENKWNSLFQLFPSVLIFPLQVWQGDDYDGNVANGINALLLMALIACDEEEI